LINAKKVSQVVRVKLILMYLGVSPDVVVTITRINIVVTLHIRR